jgi:tetratricopeptide (TPR) repeat protein
MLVHAAEDSYQKGIGALRSGRITEALALFEAAIALEKRFGVSKPQARYLSFYGLCLGLARRDMHEALRFCREAVALEEFNPDMHCNLGQVLIRAGRMRDAYKALIVGLGLQPDHTALRRTLRGIGVRRRPVIPFLARGNPINVALGRMRAQGAAPRGAGSRTVPEGRS